jgi:transposase
VSTGDDEMTTSITKSASIIVIEDLNVSGKAKWHGSTLLKTDRFYPSSKACSECGT